MSFTPLVAPSRFYQYNTRAPAMKTRGRNAAVQPRHAREAARHNAFENTAIIHAMLYKTARRNGMSPD